MARFDDISQPPQRLADKVYEQLVAAISSGAVGTRERLIQEAIADEMAVSRTPVREALLRLEQEGIIRPARSRGFELVELTPSMIRSLYESRQAVEGFAARLVAEHSSDEAIAQLQHSLAVDIDLDDGVTSYDANHAAHRAIVEATGNETLLEMFDTLWLRARPMRVLHRMWSQEAGVSVTHSHGDLFAAIVSRDGRRAESAMLEHLRAGMERLLEMLQATQAAPSR